MATLTARLQAHLPDGIAASARDQLVVAGGQMAAGVANLLFVLGGARLLGPGEFAALTAFLALYLTVHAPLTSLTAGSALSPAAAAGGSGRVLAVGSAVAAAAAVASGVLGPLVGLSRPSLLLLAAAVPGAGLLALHRGRLYGLEQHRRAAGSMLAEAGTRVTLGLGLLATGGAVAGMAGVVLAGGAGLAVALGSRRAAPATSTSDRLPLATGAVFLLLAMAQNQGFLLANRLLPDTEAASFAAVATLGGAALFALWNAPMVLIPRAAKGERSALGVALVLVTAAGLAMMAVVAFAPGTVMQLLFGGRYTEAGDLAVPYLAAATLLAVTRVLAAHRCATGRARSSALLIALGVGTHLALVVGWVQDARGLVTVTAGLAAALAGALATTEVARLPETRTWVVAQVARLRRGLAHPVAGVAVLTLGALLLRLLVPRGLWLDEALSVVQTQLPLADLIAELRTSDVHPPGHHVLLWVSVRLLGDGELAVRLPSILTGTAAVPLLYLAGRDLFNRRTGTVAAALGATAPLAVWYSQEARMYSLYLLLALAAVWLQIRVIRHGRLRSWFGYSAVTALLLWTHYFAGLQIAVQQVVFLAVVVQRRRSGTPVAWFAACWGSSIVLLLAALAPLAPFLADQLQAYAARRGTVAAHVPVDPGVGRAEAYGDISVYRIATNVAWSAFGYHPHATMTAMVASWPLAMLLCLFCLGRGPWDAPSRLLLAVASVPLALLAGVGLMVQDNLFEIRYVMGTVAVLPLLVALLVTTVTSRRAVIAGVTGVLVAGSLVSLADQQLNSANPRLYDFRGALGEVQEIHEPGDVVVYEPAYLQPVVDYYAPELTTRAARRGLPAAGRGRVIVLASFLELAPHARATTALLDELDEQRDLVSRVDRAQVQIWVFE